VFDHPDGYFFAVDMNTEKIIIHKLDKLVGYSMSKHKDLHGTPVLAEQKQLLSRSDGAFQTIYFSKPAEPDKEFPKQVYIRYFKPFNWLIGTGEYLDDMDKRLQKHVLKRLKALYTQGNDYLFIKKMYNLTGGDGKPYASLILSGNPVHRPDQPLFDTDRDSKGNYFRKDVLQRLRDHGEGFVSYWHPSPQHGQEVKKTSFFYYDDTWNWTIGSGFYYEDLETELAGIEAGIEQRIAKDIRLSMGITLLIIIVMSSIFFMISRRIARTINTYATKLEQAQKMESIGTLAGGIAHDFNNILFPILGNAEILMDDAPEGSRLKNGLQQIYSGALRARDLVRQILTFARQEKSDMEVIHIQPILKEALKLIRSTIPATIEIKQDIRPGCGQIKADPTQIHQIFMNLATNAYHAMEKDGGLLTVHLREKAFNTSDATHLDMAAGTYACLSVRDTGTGIKKELMNNIFDPFFTTKREGKGTGMGLSVVHGIVKQMKGSIQVKSTPGQGTEFTVCFPLEKNVSQESGDVSEPEITGGTAHILLVDDEESIVTMVKMMLEQLGYQVTAFANSKTALDTFAREFDNFDLVITDFAMPHIPGDKLIWKMLDIRPDIPIILNSGYHEKLSRDIIEKIGARHILSKPVKRKELARVIREALEVKP
ncbi:MAG: cache domain-containing protein, partial [Desulfobacterales bacterium]|nr:cache domain-containing protein [Desulfobacterales bacterium]